MNWRSFDLYVWQLIGAAVGRPARRPTTPASSSSSSSSSSSASSSTPAASSSAPAVPQTPPTGGGAPATPPDADAGQNAVAGFLAAAATAATEESGLPKKTSSGPTTEATGPGGGGGGAFGIVPGGEPWGFVLQSLIIVDWNWNEKFAPLVGDLMPALKYSQGWGSAREFWQYLTAEYSATQKQDFFGETPPYWNIENWKIEIRKALGNHDLVWSHKAVDLISDPVWHTAIPAGTAYQFKPSHSNIFKSQTYTIGGQGDDDKAWYADVTMTLTMPAFQIISKEVLPPTPAEWRLAIDIGKPYGNSGFIGAIEDLGVWASGIAEAILGDLWDEIMGG